ncbi:MAG: hypothetical protein A3B10_00400 [Candidatus Doudnabacteria bacterium RIFCSPLOWO2_01_FULL_44_21]|uniref:DOD-type homing endonuclease domain-containing protein n=1 Tax=Candidatus Doudnabacteria bacterium RIFCSPLOWO2_01_FULL_44_21 TaxID=1817841 RepID=A0A1F5PXG3_9BACT|nr:MAG: hypothetical protein A3B10_00400 [Candidatus Doudnabacteria bacterium RIFCSPLOWO2_01_FULL_44_21]
MGKRGPKPKPIELIRWSSNLAYAVGLLATDGCLYNDGRHINFTSKDIQLIRTFKKCLGLKNKVSRKSGGFTKEKKYYFVQFGNVSLYKFLIDSGLTVAKSKTLNKILVPDNYLADLVRGLFDGDGSFSSYYDPRWPKSFLYYLSFISASKDHLIWLRKNIQQRLGINGHGVDRPYSRAYKLKYAKREAKKIIDFIYYKPNIPCLERKRKKIYNALKTENKQE